MTIPLLAPSTGIAITMALIINLMLCPWQQTTAGLNTRAPSTLRWKHDDAVIRPSYRVSDPDVISFMRNGHVQLKQLLNPDTLATEVLAEIKKLYELHEVVKELRKEQCLPGTCMRHNR
jgi:hypothetical protein